MNSSKAKKKDIAANKKVPKWFYVILFFLPVMILVASEIILRVFDYGYNLEQWIDSGQGKYILNPDIGRRYFTSGDFNPNSIEDTLTRKKNLTLLGFLSLAEAVPRGIHLIL